MMRQGDSIRVGKKELMCVEVNEDNYLFCDGDGNEYILTDEQLNAKGGVMLIDEDKRFRIKLSTIYITLLSMTIQNLTQPFNQEPFISMEELPNSLHQPMRELISGSKRVVSLLQRDKLYFKEEAKMRAISLKRIEFPARLFEILMSVVDEETLKLISSDITGVIQKHLGKDSIIEI